MSTPPPTLLEALGAPDEMTCRRILAILTLSSPARPSEEAA